MIRQCNTRGTVREPVPAGWMLDGAEEAGIGSRASFEAKLGRLGGTGEWEWEWEGEGWSQRG